MAERTLSRAKSPARPASAAYTSYRVELPTPMGIGLDAKNLVVELKPAGSAAIDGKVRVGDVLSAVDGVEVRGGCRSVANVIQANKDLPSHTLVLLRKKPPEMERAAHKDLTVRLDLGGATLLGLKADNANVIVEIYDGGVAGLDGRLQIGDQILSVDMNAVHAGNVEDALALGTFSGTSRRPMAARGP